MAERVLNLKQSSNIKGAVYSADDQTLTVQFHNGGTYSYSGFDADKADAFERADSPGNFLHTQIKGQHVHTKIA
jgi:hypothetical protein